MKTEILFNCAIETQEDGSKILVRTFNEKSPKMSSGSRLDIYTEEQLIQTVFNDVSEQIHWWYSRQKELGNI